MEKSKDLIRSSVRLEKPCYSPNLSTKMDSLQNFHLTEFNATWFSEFLAQMNCNCTVFRNINKIANLMCMAPPMVEHSWWVQSLYFVMFLTIIILSIGGNSLVIWVILFNRKMRTVTNYFLINLAIADASISLFNVCFTFTYNLFYDWMFDSNYCIFNNFMTVVPTCASVFTLVAICLDRYVALVYPLKRHMSRTKTIAVICVIWTAAFFCGLPMLLCSYTKNVYYQTGEISVLCLTDHYPDGDTHSSVLYLCYNYFLSFVTYLLPLTVLSIAYTKIGFVLWGSQRIGENVHAENIKNKRKVIKMMIVVVVAFFICWLPYQLYFTILIKILAHYDLYRSIHLYINMYWLAMSSTTYNPIIYCYMNKKFRVGFKYALRWLPCIKMNEDENSFMKLSPASYGQTSLQKICPRRSESLNRNNINSSISDKDNSSSFGSTKQIRCSAKENRKVKTPLLSPTLNKAVLRVRFDESAI